ncbi:Rab GTPase activating protein [Entamoeba marina]
MVNFTTNFYIWIFQKSIFYDTYISDPELNELKSIALQNGLSGLYLRTIAWRVWLGVLPTPVNPEWSHIIKNQRIQYETIRKKYYKGDEQLINNSISIEEHEDINLRIQKDIDRLFNMYDYFTNKEFRIIITRMLYIFARENPNINYQQGLHELISLFYRCIDFDLSEQVRIKWTNSMSFPTSYLNVVELLIDRNYIEHDTYVLFEHLMEQLGSVYEIKKNDDRRETSAIQLKCDVLFEQINNIDKKYYDVLISHDVIPKRDDPSYTLRRLMKYPPVIALHSMILTAIKLCGGKITCGTPANESKTLNPVRLKRERRKAVKDKSLIEINQSKKHIITIPNIINDAEQTTVDHDELRAIQQNILSVMNSL